MSLFIKRNSIPECLFRDSRKVKKAYLTTFHSEHSPTSRVTAFKMFGFPSGWNDDIAFGWLLMHREHIDEGTLDPGDISHNLSIARKKLQETNLLQHTRRMMQAVLDADCNNPEWLHMYRNMTRA